MPELTNLSHGSQERAVSRQEAIDDYVRTLAEETQPLRKVIGFARAELMEMASQLSNCIKEAFAEDSSSLEAFEEAAPAMELQLKYYRMFERYQLADSRLAPPCPPTASDEEAPSSEELRG